MANISPEPRKYSQLSNSECGKVLFVKVFIEAEINTFGTLPITATNELEIIYKRI